MKVSFITDPEQKESISLSVMHRLPLWFSPPEDIDRKAVIHRDYPFFAVFDRNKPVAFAAVKIHNPIPPISIVSVCWRNINARALGTSWCGLSWNGVPKKTLFF